MNYYTLPLVVNIHDVDPNGVCRASAMLRFMQSSAEAQLSEYGMSYDELKEKKRAFILSRIYMEFAEAPRAGVPLSAATYPCESRGYSFMRCYELYKEEKLIGQAVSVFALIDTDTHALLPVDSFALPFPAGQVPATVGQTRFRLPVAMEDCGTYTVRYADLDQNGHMNNTHYPDIYADFLPLGGRRISSLSLIFGKEAKKGDTLRVRTVRDGDFYYFTTTLPDGSLNSEARIALSDI